jgi:transcriptional regulator with XRE-family HTH domain
MIGDNIRKRREELNLSQEELALKLGYKSRSSINKIEKNLTDIPQSKISEFANALETSVTYLMGWTKKEENLKDMVERLLIENGFSTSTDKGKEDVLKVIQMAVELYKMRKGD